MITTTILLLLLRVAKLCNVYVDPIANNNVPLINNVDNLAFINFDLINTLIPDDDDDCLRRQQEVKEVVVL